MTTVCPVNNSRTFYALRYFTESDFATFTCTERVSPGSRHEFYQNLQQLVWWVQQLQKVRLNTDTHSGEVRVVTA